MKKATTIAVDVAQAVLEVAVSLRPGKVAAPHRLQRSEVLTFFAQQAEATVVLEACGSASYWAREVEKLGHHAVLLPPQHVRRYRTRNKTDRADAKALLEAYRNEEIRRVPVKTPAQQALAALHRLRSAWLGTRTARLNTIRGLLREQGLPIPVGAHQLRVTDPIGDDALPRTAKRKRR